MINQTLARLQDAFERLRRFTADASHELRTPLTALRSVGEVALRAPDFHARSRETIVSMLEENERLTQLVDGLLMLTRESTEAYRARFASVPLGHVTREAVDLLRALAEEKDQRLDVEVDGTLLVRGDRNTLRQAVLNLVDNAIKYTPRGGRVVVRADRADDGMVAIAVEDSGIGIPATDLPRLTERFFRVDRGRSRALGGTGLGLAIVKHIVQAHGGELAIESTVSMGTTVRVYFPAVTATRAALS